MIAWPSAAEAEFWLALPVIARLALVVLPGDAVYDALVDIEPDQARREGLVFTGRSGAAWGQIRTAFTRALERAGIRGGGPA